MTGVVTHKLHPRQSSGNVYTPQNLDLRAGRIHKDRLPGAARGLPPCQGTSVPIAPHSHLAHQRLMPPIKGLQFPLPPQGFWMLRIALLAVH